MNSSSNPKRASSGKHTGASIVLLLVVVAAAAGGIVMRLHEASALNKDTKAAAIPDVVIIQAPKGPATDDIALPGTIQAWHEAPIFARTSGYLKDWKTDIGTHVKAGDLIAEIASPEVDAQLHQAEADFNTAQANDRLARSTADRWTNLLKTGSVSKQDADDKVAAAAADNALVAAAQANVNRLHELVSFERIVAPFDGVITARNTDTGALIDAGSNGTGPELFHIAETDKLRVYVQVPEMYVDAIKPDLTADMKLGEYPGRSFPAKLSNTADALDPNTRTLLIELEVDNDKGELLPGGFAEVHLKLPAPETTVILPVNTLLFRAQGMQVATVDDESHVQLKSIVIGQDYGTQVQVKSGITPGENIIVNPPDSIATGQTVHVQNNGDDKDDGKDGQSGDDNGGDDKNSDGKNTDGTDKNKDGGE